ncbi:DUF6000 family protein [Sorangium sp. So ce327]|jgi:hypothetical protein|uniref:DUF6000 family protein n=1 Tax=Sorangium sp. So ce327 TaxID=3133301 RepID=UPI003F63744F
MDAWSRHGSPLYLLLLHANFLDEPPERRHAFARQFLDAVTSLPDLELGYWLNGSWREQLTAAWIIAARRLATFRGVIGERLLASATCYAGQGFSVATARYEDHPASDALTLYLQSYLPVGDREYDQEWAVGSLVWLDARLAANRAAPFLKAPELWKVSEHGRELGALDPGRGVERVARAMAFLDDLGASEVS